MLKFCSGVKTTVYANGIPLSFKKGNLKVTVIKHSLKVAGCSAFTCFFKINTLSQLRGHVISTSCV